MSDTCTLQLHASGVWHDVASVKLHGPENQGWKTRTYSGYATEWIFPHLDATDAHALCARWPVGIEALELPHWPVFLIDLLPQGFGRQVSRNGVARLAQESIATLTGMPGFEALPSHDQVCRALLRHCSSPQDEVLEYLRRDVANLALGNKDNHARNTAVRRDFEGRIALTPLFDFAPMYLHPDGIARRIRWEGHDGGQPDWVRVLDRVCALGPLQRAPLVHGLQAMVPALQQLAAEGEAWGLEPDVLGFLRPGIFALARQLATLV